MTRGQGSRSGGQGHSTRLISLKGKYLFEHRAKKTNLQPFEINQYVINQYFGSGCEQICIPSCQLDLNPDPHLEYGSGSCSRILSHFMGVKASYGVGLKSAQAWGCHDP
jgi:hypothetical protein